MVYDVTDHNSFNHVKDWLEEINKYTDNKPIKLIVGNKCDLNSDKKISDFEMNSLRQKTGLDIIEVSAKNSIRITDMMELITKKLIERTKNPDSKEDNITTDKGYVLDTNKATNNNNSDDLCCGFA